MHTALISDIHGNLVALDAVLAELGNESIDQILCLGDVVEGGPQPLAVLERLRELGCPIVMGNTDERMSTARLDEPRTPDLPPEYATELWCVDQLTSADRAMISSFPLTMTLPLSDDTMLLGFHGSPRKNTEGIFATTSNDDLAQILDGCKATILAGGHTHTQLVRRYLDMIFINPGSVGLPYEWTTSDTHPRRPPWAEYAIVTTSHGHVSIDLRRTPINVAVVIRSAEMSGMPYSKW